MLRELLLVLAIIALIFFSACIDYENEALLEEYKQRCLNLTAYDAGYVPQCSTQEECFTIINKELFDFSDRELSLESKQILYYYQTHIAKSWYYYNEAMHYLKKIRSACSEKNFDLAVESANDFRYYIEKSFEESDLALGASFGFIIYEKNYLEKQDINMIKEEALYSFYIKLSDNERQIFSEEKLNLNNYAVDSRRLIEESANKRAMAGAKFEIIKKKTLFELFVGTLGLPLEYYIYKNKDKSVFLPIFEGLPSQYAEFLSNLLTTERMLEFLSNERPDEFLKLLSKLIGKRSSLASDFSVLAKEASLRKIFLVDSLNSLEKTIEEKISIAKTKAQFFTQNSFGYADANFLSNLQKLLNEPLVISFENPTFVSPADAFLNAVPKIVAIENELRNIKNETTSGRITIGARTTKLKELNNEINKIISSLENLEESINILILRCDYELSSQPETNELAILKEKYRLASKEEKLMYCSKYVSLRAKIKEEAEKRSANEVLLYQNECDEKLEILMRFVKDDFLEEKYKHLLDSNNVLKDCETLLLAAEENIRKNYPINEIEDMFLEIARYNAIIEKFFLERENLFYELKIYFGSKGLLLDKAMPKIYTIKDDVSTLQFKMINKMANFLSEQITKNCEIKALSFEEISIKLGGSEKVRSDFFFYFDNSLIDFNKPLKVSLDFKAQNCELKTKSPNIFSVVFSEKNIFIEFSGLPLGSTYFEFACYKELSFERTSRSVTLNPDLGIVSERYKFVSNATIPRIKIFAEKVQDATARVIFKEREYPLFLSTEFFTTVLFDLKPEETLLLNYTVIAPLEIKSTILHENRIDENNYDLTYLCKIKNKTQFDSKESFFIYPIPQNYVSIEILDESGKKLNYYREGSTMRIYLDYMPAYGERHIYIKLVINDMLLFRKGLIDEIKKILDGINDDSLKEEASNIQAKLQDANTLSISKLAALHDEAIGLQKKENSKQQLQKHFFSLKESLEAELTKLNSELETAKELNLDELCDLISQKISYAEEMLLLAQQTFNADPTKAMSFLDKAFVKIQERVPSTEEHIREKAKTIFEFSNKQLESLKEINLSDNKTVDLVKKASSSYNIILSELTKGNTTKAASELSVLETVAQDLNSYSLSLVEMAFVSLKENVQNVLEISQTYPFKVKFLLEQLDNTPKELLIEAKYLPEFNDSKIASLEKTLSQSKDFIWLEAMQLIESEQKHTALKFANSKKLYQKISAIQEAFTELCSIEKNLKKSAEEQFLTLKANANKIGSQDVIFAVEKALKDKNYLQAIVYSKVALASLEKNGAGENITSYWPVFIVFAIATIYSIKNIRKKKEKPRFKRVFRHTNNLKIDGDY
ncbi:MAG: hypothetical protein QXM75_03080 [Candidatus Diapherotrites archaeon]